MAKRKLTTRQSTPVSLPATTPTPVGISGPPPGAGTISGPPPGTPTTPTQSTNPTAPNYKPPPESYAGANTRIDAREKYNLGMGDVNQRLLQASMNYGGVDKVAQAGYDPTGGDTTNQATVTANPNSVLAQLQRLYDSNSKNEQESQNGRNTFFSGIHAAAQGKLGDETNLQRQQAKVEYDNSVTELLQALSENRAARESAFRTANMQDVDESRRQAASAVPGPTADPGAAGTGTMAQSSSGPKPGYTNVQTVGSRAGLSYKVTKSGNRKFRVYENGDKIPF